MREQVEALLQRAYRDVYALVDRNRAATAAIAEALIQREDLDSDEIAELIRNAERPSYAEIAAAAISNAASAPYAIAAPQWARRTAMGTATAISAWWKVKSCAQRLVRMPATRRTFSSLTPDSALHLLVGGKG